MQYAFQTGNVGYSLSILAKQTQKRGHFLHSRKPFKGAPCNPSTYYVASETRIVCLISGLTGLSSTRTGLWNETNILRLGLQSYLPDWPLYFRFIASPIVLNSVAISVKEGLCPGSDDQHLSIKDLQLGSHQLGIGGRNALFMIPPIISPQCIFA